MINANVINQQSASGSKAGGSAAVTGDSKAATHTDDPARFSAIYRMFEARTAPPKSEKGTTAERQPPPTNRLKPKKASISTMTESTNDDDDDDVNNYDLQADDMCGSSTFDQQTETDIQTGRGNVTNRKIGNGVTASTATENVDLERNFLEGDDESADGETIKRERETGGEITPKRSIERHELLSPSDQTSKTIQWKSGSNLPNSHKLEFQGKADKGISDAGDATGRPNNRVNVAQCDYANVASINPQGSSTMYPEQGGNTDQRMTRPIIKGNPNSVSVDSPEPGSADKKHATAVPPCQAGMVTGPHDDGDPGRSGSKCTGKMVRFDSSKNSCDQMADLNSVHTRSPNQQILKTQLQENDEEFDSSRSRMLSSHTGKTVNSSLSKASHESADDYQNLEPQRISSKDKRYQKDSTEIGNRSKTKHSAEKSTGECNSSDEDKYKNEYDYETLPNTQHQHQHQQQQKYHSAAGQHPSEPVTPGSNKESGTRKQASSSTSTENAQPFGRGSNIASLQSAQKDVFHSNQGSKEADQKREFNSRTTSETGNQSFGKSVSTNTEDTKYSRAKTCAELQCQTDSFYDPSQSKGNVQELSTDSQEEDSLKIYSWYFGDVDRELADAILEDMINEPGSYLVRRSYRGGEGNPYTLSVVYLKRIYHVLIRQRPDGRFSIGKEKDDDKIYSSVPDLITFYRNNFVELIGDAAKKMPPGKVQLKTCPPK